MRHLLDAHTLLWYTLADPKLSMTAKALILDPANAILISPASYIGSDPAFDAYGIKRLW